MNTRHPKPVPLLQIASRSLLLLLLCSPALAQTEMDTLLIGTNADTVRFWLQIPQNYNPAQPPAILIWWHQLGGNQLEMRSSLFDSVADARGWIAASHAGPNDRHWNTTRAQLHCRDMLDWIAGSYPFHLDSIYMIGGSMGGAGGQVWHNNNCGESDYLIAATAGASQILDCQLRQEQYLAMGDTNRSMRAAFGGLPTERDSVAFQYHRASAVYLADTSQSMHFNALNLPVWATWGNTDLERIAYGDPAFQWNQLREAGSADTTVWFETSYPCHGLGCMPAAAVCDWLAGFAANRHPDTLSINADENGEYYWTEVYLAQSDTIFGRYGVAKRPDVDELDITLVRNLQTIRVNASTLNLVLDEDTLSGTWINLDPGIPSPEVVLVSIPHVAAVFGPDETSAVWSYDSTEQICTVSLAENGQYRLVIARPQDNAVGTEPPALPHTHALIGSYPNPFNAEATLSIHSNGGSTEMLVYDVTGRLVRTVPLSLDPGENRVVFDAREYGSGIFFVQLRGSSRPPLKLVLLR